MEQKETYWSRFADDFEERNNYVVGKTDMEIMLHEVASEKLSGKVLEMGCGNGTYSRILAQSAEHLYATDFSDEMVEASKNRLQDLKNVSVEKANCFELQYEDNSFDAVFMANLLHIIPEPEKALAEAKRVLKPGGRILILSFTAEGMKFLNKLRMIYRYLKTYGKPSPHAHNLKLSTVEEMLSKEGLQADQARLPGEKMKAIFINAKKES